MFCQVTWFMWSLFIVYWFSYWYFVIYFGCIFTLTRYCYRGVADNRYFYGFMQLRLIEFRKTRLADVATIPELATTRPTTNKYETKDKAIDSVDYFRTIKSITNSRISQWTPRRRSRRRETAQLQHSFTTIRAWREALPNTSIKIKYNL